MSISTGLVAAYNKQASGASWLDLTGNGNHIPLTNTSWVAGGLQGDANGEYGTIDNTGEVLINSVSGSIIFYFTSFVSFANATARIIIGRFNGSWLAGTISLYKSANSLVFLISEVTDSLNHSITINSIPTYETGTMIGLHWDINNIIYDNKKLSISINAEYVTPSASSNATSWNPVTILADQRVLADIDGTRTANGVKEYLYIFNTVKTEAELMTINANHNLILADYFKKDRQKFNIGFNLGI